MKLQKINSHSDVVDSVVHDTIRSEQQQQIDTTDDEEDVSFDYKLHTSTNDDEAIYKQQQQRQQQQQQQQYDLYQIEVTIDKNKNKIDKIPQQNVENNIIDDLNNQTYQQQNTIDKEDDDIITTRKVEIDIKCSNKEEKVESSIVPKNTIRTTTSSEQIINRSTISNKRYQKDKLDSVLDYSTCTEASDDDDNDNADDATATADIATTMVTTVQPAKTPSYGITTVTTTTITKITTIPITNTTKSVPKSCSNHCSKTIPMSSSRPIQQRNLCLPDVDDMSMNNVFTYVEIYHQDKIWSYLSDTFFVVGSIAYLILSVWDWLAEISYNNNDNNTNTNTITIEGNTWYRILDIFAPFVYVANSIIDTQWAFSEIRKESIKRNMQQGWNDFRTYINDDNDINSKNNNTDNNSNQHAGCNICCYAMTTSIQATSTSTSFIPQMEQHQHQEEEHNNSWWWNNTSSIQTCCWDYTQSIRKHVAHRRSLLAAITFGIAATAEFIIRFISDSTIIVSYCEIISTHTYVLSAIISVTGKRVRPWLYKTHNLLWCDPERLEDTGDIVFLIGCVIDAIIDDCFSSNTNAPIISVLTSLLWLIDSLFYFRADIVRTDQEHSTEVLNNDSNYLI